MLMECWQSKNICISQILWHRDVFWQLWVNTLSTCEYSNSDHVSLSNCIEYFMNIVNLLLTFFWLIKKTQQQKTKHTILYWCMCMQTLYMYCTSKLLVHKFYSENSRFGSELYDVRWRCQMIVRMMMMMMNFWLTNMSVAMCPQSVIIMLLESNRGLYSIILYITLLPFWWLQWNICKKCVFIFSGFLKYM